MPRLDPNIANRRNAGLPLRFSGYLRQIWWRASRPLFDRTARKHDPDGKRKKPCCRSCRFIASKPTWKSNACRCCVARIPRSRLRKPRTHEYFVQKQTAIFVQRVYKSRYERSSLKERVLTSMSSGSERDRPCGVLRQGAKVVGCICMPEATEIFIKEFNHCYGQLRLEVSAPILESPSDAKNPSTFRLPMWFRHVWHSTNPES